MTEKDQTAAAAKVLEKQIEAECPELDPETRRRLANMGASIATKKETAKPVEKDQPEKAQNSELVQLDFWNDGRRAAPNAVFRSALFPALDKFS